MSEISSLVASSFHEHLEAGLVELVAPDAAYYPDFDRLKLTLGDKMEQVSVMFRILITVVK